MRSLIIKSKIGLPVVWCTKRVKTTDTGRPVFQTYGSTRKNTGRPVNYTSTRIYGSTRIFELRVDPYFCGSTRIFTGRPVFKIRVDPYFTGRPVNASRPVKIRVDPYYTGRPDKIRVYPYFCGSTRIFTGRPVYLKYGSTRIGAFDPLGTPYCCTLHFICCLLYFYLPLNVCT